ncbi:YchJ family protein [Reichenbachiella agarivorans]|uniref:YchJ family protein n=1 Tax=Reichenbachiella agarivorans TaxID=2979464 RepID=A0ABY6CK39_9BACT|nr:YchJ family protein [Reichenbachiella agarivorans]UXP30890.1 YchJ family protein [Reichenbachiella agarivorans]
MNDCPCCSGKPFASCCETIINNQSAPTALALMRSRYTAYALGKADYLYQTTHSQTRSQYNIQEIKKWSQENTWTQLEIITVEHGRVSDDRGIVEFKAHFTDERQQVQIHHEKSIFLKEDQQWFYLEGKINPQEIDLMKKISRNDPCPCGSGKKYKKCCA